MAGRGNPNPKGSKPDKILRDALMIAVNREEVVEGQRIKRVALIAERLAKAASTGDVDLAAIREVWDRIEGKPAQSLGLGQAEDLEPIKTEATIRPTLTREEWLKVHRGDS